MLLKRMYGLGIPLFFLFAVSFPSDSAARNTRDNSCDFLTGKEVVAEKPASSDKTVITFQTASGEKFTGSVVYVNGKKYDGKIEAINRDAIFLACQLDGDQRVDYGEEAAAGVIDLYTYPDCTAEEPDLPLQCPEAPAIFGRGDADDFARWIEGSLPKRGKELTGIYVSFVITSGGKLCRPLITNDCDAGLAEKILAKIGQSPKWTPARHNKSRVDSRVNALIVAFADSVRDFVPDRTPTEAKQGESWTRPQFEGKPPTNFKEFIASNVHYPPHLIMRIRGRVVGSMVIRKDGLVSNIKILQSPNDLLSIEVYRAIAKSPRWTPGKDGNGNPVDIPLSIPIDFR